MSRIIITILLFCLTFCSHNIALAAKLKIKPTLVTSISVTNPGYNSLWMQNKSYFIHWETLGKKPDTVKVVLLKIPGETRVHVIKESIPDTGSCIWKIPGMITPGRYKIQVRVSNTRIYDRSDEFTIGRELKAKSVDLSSKLVIVIKPKKNRKYTPGAYIPISWETELHKEILNTNNSLYFDIDLYDRNGVKKIYTIAKRKDFHDYHLGGKRYRTKWFWNPSEGNSVIRTGQYKIKITPKFADKDPAGVPGFSDKFNISRGVEKLTQLLKPEIRNRHSLQMRYFTNSDEVMIKPPIPDVAKNRPGNARVGYHNWIVHKDWGAYLYHGFVFRSQMYFPVDRQRETGKLILKATLHLTVDGYAASPNHQRKATCSKALYYMTGPWSGKCTDTPGYLIKSIPDQSSLTIDITQFAQNWYTGSQPNHGLMLLSWDEKFEHNKLGCITWYKAELVLEYLREVKK